MIRLRVDQLVGGEVLADAVVTPDYKVLLSGGTILRASYINRIKENGILFVNIEDNSRNSCKAVSAVTEKIREESKVLVSDIMKKHDFGHNEGLRELTVVAESIISDVLSNEHMMHEIFDVKARNSDLYEHSLEVCVLSTVISLKMGYSGDRVREVAMGALLHDIGLKYIVVHYDNCSINSMPKPERNEYKKHPVYGYSAIKNEEWLPQRAKQIILYHHESLDGSGYPLQASKVPEECMIVAVCDVFDEMICGIGYEAVPVYEAIEYLKAYRGLKYPENAVLTFVKSIALYPVGNEVILNNGKHALVLWQNEGFPDRPVLQLLEKNQGTEEKSRILNMMEEMSIFIVGEAER